MTATLISHFYNEQYLLPHWLKHHVPMFDHGIMIDYASTDSSVDIIHRLAPTWEVRQSIYDLFLSPTNDAEVMAVEREVDGWKFVANTTEFLVCPDFPALLAGLEANGCNATKFRPIALVDPLKLRDVPIDPDVPLIDQRHYGFVHGDTHESRVIGYRSRMIHRHADGAYTNGRHGSRHIGGENQTNFVPGHLGAYSGNAAVLWLCAAPFVPEWRARKAQVRDRMDDENRDRFPWSNPDLGSVENQLEQWWHDEQPAVVDLRTVPEYVDVMAHRGV